MFGFCYRLGKGVFESMKYVPKVASTPFFSQMVVLQAFSLPPFESGKDEQLHGLCPVRALKTYCK